MFPVPPHIFTDAERALAEARWGVAYYPVAGATLLVPATHAGPGRVASIDAGDPLRQILNWRVVDLTTGATVKHGHERNHARSRAGWARCIRSALLEVRAAGCTRRVRPRFGG